MDLYESFNRVPVIVMACAKIILGGASGGCQSASNLYSSPSLVASDTDSTPGSKFAYMQSEDRNTFQRQITSTGEKQKTTVHRQQFVWFRVYMYVDELAARVNNLNTICDV